MKDLFRELTVVELASVLAGPSVGMFFAELGARVIKVESPSGDVTRGWKLPDESPDSNVSAYFSSVNYHKEYVSLDLKDPSDREHLNAILKEADVLIQNWKEGDAEKFGLSAGSLMARFPKLIIADLSGFALETQRVAYDIVLQAETGWLSMTGHPGGGPAKLPVALIDLLAGHQLKEGILAALWQRERTGTGAQVAVSLEESALASLANQASNYLMCGNIPGPMGTAHPNIAPYGEIFRCRDDRPLLLAVGSDVQFQKLCSILGHPEWAEQAEFRTNQQRVAHRALLAETLSTAFPRDVRDAWMEALVAAHIPCAAVRTLDEVLTGPVAQKMIREENIQGTPTRRLSSLGFDLRSGHAGE